MIVCRQCGHHNEDSDTFCGSCGKFLEWTGERVVVAKPEPPPAPPPQPEPARAGFIDRVKQAVGIEDTAPAAQPHSDPAAPSAAPAAAPAPAPVATAASPVATAASPAARPTSARPEFVAAAAPPTPVAASVLSPPAPPPSAPAAVPAPSAPPAATAPPAAAVDEPYSRRPTAVAPAVPRPRPAPRPYEAPTRRQPGDLICGQCGEGNDPVRHFCRRCGNSLDEAAAVKIPWYRRFFRPKVLSAGERHRGVGAPGVGSLVFRLIRLAVLAVVVLGVLAYALIPSFRTNVNEKVMSVYTPIRKAVAPRYDPVHPLVATATSFTPGHTPDKVIDGFKNTYWAGDLPRDPKPTLSLTFAQPVDLAQILITSGAPDNFQGQARPHELHIVFSDGSSKDIALSDEAKPQQFAIDAKQVIKVEIHINSFYPSLQGQAVAIQEIEFFTKN